MHTIAAGHVAVIGFHEIVLYHLDGMKRKRIRIIAVRCRNVCFNRMGHSVHARMSDKLLRHGFRQIGIYDSDIRGNFIICNRVFDAFIIIGDYRKRRHLGCCA
ncbi:hypothetical protein SDC9_175911 [bioreactor metagenome]|uniref:Uncharacterized protein n=1 Tax=bioreactor metagenome TaxID=1076179 RepID=A0A645GRK5_9ZZZZ